MAVTLRPFEDGDLDQLFVWEQDPRAVAMASFTRPDPSDRAAFDAHYVRVRSDPANTLLSIEDDGVFVGTIGSYTMHGDRDVTYWIDPARWGQGVASVALAVFLGHETARPLFGRVAEHNVGSSTVLTRAGFELVGTDTGFAGGLGREVVEATYRLTE